MWRSVQRKQYIWKAADHILMLSLIHILAAECEKPVMLYSIGKDSSVMLHLAMKAFYPEKPPFPFLHIDTTWKFHEMIEFRDRIAKENGIDMLVQRKRSWLEESRSFRIEDIGRTIQAAGIYLRFSKRYPS